MSEILINLQGYGTAKLALDLIDGGDIEVWRGVFCDDDDEVLWEVYFEMEEDYEIWDVVNEAIHTYRREADDIQ
jgi:hypothetical protein